MRITDNFPFLSVWKIYMIPLILVCFLNYLILFAFYLDNHLPFVLNLFTFYSALTFVMSIMIYIGERKSVNSFLVNYIFCKAVKFIISLALLVIFLRNEPFEYEYGLISLGLIFLVTQICDNYIFLNYTDKIIMRLYTMNY